MLLLSVKISLVIDDSTFYYDVYTVIFSRIAGHPLAQNERCLHMFLQEVCIDKNYVPGKIRNT